MISKVIKQQCTLKCRVVAKSRVHIINLEKRRGINDNTRTNLQFTAEAVLGSTNLPVLFPNGQFPCTMKILVFYALHCEFLSTDVKKITIIIISVSSIVIVNKFTLTYL